MRASSEPGLQRFSKLVFFLKGENADLPLSYVWKGGAVQPGFCLILFPDGRHFLLPQARATPAFEILKQHVFSSKKNLLGAAVQTDHDQQEYQEEEGETRESVDYRSCGGVGHHLPDSLLRGLASPQLEGSSRDPGLAWSPWGWARVGTDRLPGCCTGGYCHLLLPPLTLATAPPSSSLPLRNASEA